MTSKEPKAMEEIHVIREQMHALTEGMNVHEKLLFIKERAVAYKSASGLKTRRLGRKEKDVVGQK